MRKGLFYSGLVGILCVAREATAMGAPQGEGGGNQGFLILIVGIFAIMYFFMIRPQQKKQKEKEEMLRAIKEGDRVVTAGGIHGTVKSVKETTVRVQVDDHTRIEFEKTSISGVLSPTQATPEKSA